MNIKVMCKRKKKILIKNFQKNNKKQHNKNKSYSNSY